MSKYRPQGWKNPHEQINDFGLGNQTYYGVNYDAFEAGADAMLEALSKMPIHNLTITSTSKIPNGHYIFIPDDKEDVK